MNLWCTVGIVALGFMAWYIPETGNQELLEDISEDEDIYSPTCRVIDLISKPMASRGI